MFKNLFLFVKYPYVSGIIITLWAGAIYLILSDSELPIVRMVVINMAASFIIALIGFRVEKTN